MKFIYVLFLGLFLALFVGFGISVFYKGPVQPEYPKELYHDDIEPMTSGDQPVPKSSPSADEKKLREEHEAASDKYFKELMPSYNRRVSIIAIAASIIYLILSLVVLRKIDILSDGVLFGGVLTLAYGIIRALMGENNIYSFVVVTIGLVIALILGYVKFIRPDKKST